MAEILKGNIQQINIIDLLGLLTKAKHSGRLSVITTEGEGFVFLNQGRIYAAMLGKKKGYEALFDLARLVEGDFSFEDKFSTSEKHFEEDTNILLKKITEDLKTFTSVTSSWNKIITLIPKPQEIALSAKEWVVVALSQKKLTISEIAQAGEIDPVEVLKIEKRLENLGLAKLQDKEKTVEEKTQKSIPPIFWKTLKAELASLIGPIAEAVIEDEIEGLNETKEAFPYDKISVLIERISQEIDEADRRTAFQKKMLDVLKRI
ncbi:MAG TPA: DUF4388 domain-containing protein [Candidatus Desulfofervidus auxilii]|uniref:DUF4388 domain-containing protein n=1 Tax=Desulfofervidus auxilii TaxID=1621989 RepID=A0A7C0U463_DESA2|nr:DUF4388 domain-containing protein [Candidatus Desulfofervidus auxilii]